MPVSQKTGPDGCLYILDWYDRYHCYQDAGRDPKGIDRKHGRLYRVRYKETPRAPQFDLSKESDETLIERLRSPNVYFRDRAQRLLTEMASPETRSKLEKMILAGKAPRKARMHALWALIGGGNLDPDFHASLLTHDDPAYRAWGVRAAGNQGKVEPKVRALVVGRASDKSHDVLLQTAIAAPKMQVDAMHVLVEVLAHAGKDKLLPAIVWQNLVPLVRSKPQAFLDLLAKRKGTPNLGKIMPRMVDLVLSRQRIEPEHVSNLLGHVAEGPHADTGAARQCLVVLAAKLQTGEIAGAAYPSLSKKLKPVLAKHLAADPASPLRREAGLLAATFRDPKGLDFARKTLSANTEPEEVRLRAMSALMAAGDKHILDSAELLLADKKLSHDFRARVLSDLGRLDHPRVATDLLPIFEKLDPDLRPMLADVLTQRKGWAKALVQAVADKKIPKDAVNINHIRRLMAFKDVALAKQVKTHWGALREDRNPEREKVVAQMRELLRKTPGDETKGIVVFKNICGQCHKLHGEGEEVGPDLTNNGRATFEQLLSNVFDPSLVIGASYQAVTIETVKGRQITGVLVEDNEVRVVLKIAGGKQEVIARKNVETVTVSKLSLMPEGIEKQLKPQEIADLFAYLTLDKHPSDPKARYIPGTPHPKRKK
jgi:putative heme-binding domain-containing protein